MAADTKIEWCHHTFNPWRGCTKVSAGCANCYAETFSGRNPKVLGVWGPNGTRVVAAESQWKEPLKWDKEAARLGVRRRVFCASLADVFEGPETMPAEAWPKVRAARVRLFHLMNETPRLDWLLLTKRPENVSRFCSEERSWSESPPPNLWLGTSVENQAAADARIPHLLKVPAAVRFLSCEPLLGPVDLKRWLWAFDAAASSDIGAQVETPTGDLNWVIVGGESGHGARPFAVEWAWNLRAQSAAAGVAFFCKQLGARPCEDAGGPLTISLRDLKLADPKGGDISEFPADLQVREFPAVVPA